MMIKRQDYQEFYRDKKVLITGHTGFKGTWLCQVLLELGAIVIGYSTEPPTNPSLFELTHMEKKVRSYAGDIRNLAELKNVFRQEQPEIVIHMAAQPLVRESYRNPVATYETNVMGTVNILECIRLTRSVKSVVNVTTDKVYRNNEWEQGYVETDYLDGYDPYSNSKSCSELVTHSYTQSFLEERKVAVSTCRAGNVIGGGDFAADRIIPDCVRAAMSGQNINVRNPYSTRPYQHVLEPLFVYLMVAMEQYKDNQLAGCYNVGPEDSSCITTGELVELFCNTWKAQVENSDVQRVDQVVDGPHEANYLKLDCTKLQSTFQWRPKWSIKEAIEQVVEFEKIRLNMYAEDGKKKLSQNLCTCMQHQIERYIQ